jgi:hypothetical protein
MDKTTVDTIARQLLEVGARSTYDEKAKAIVPADLLFDDKTEINVALHRLLIARAAQTITYEPIRVEVLRMVEQNERGVQEPSVVDLSFFKEAAKRTTDQYGKPRQPYAPEGKPSTLKMDLEHAVLVRSTQEAYSDNSTYMVPVSGSLEGVDFNQANANLARFFRYADTHTGWAGSGSNWSAALVVNEKGPFVQIDCRASISD